jgi:hypothetical protein
MNDQLDPFFDNGRDYLGPEFDAVRGEDGPKYGGDSEDDRVLAMLKELGL